MTADIDKQIEDTLDEQLQKTKSELIVFNTTPDLAGKVDELDKKLGAHKKYTQL